ncbi:MAG: type I-E CRISPR-associated protein Cas7/Cse4/CasC [Burkholderiaceae bacterium]
MSRFIQLHILTSYPPSNLNRDDTGRPKTAVVGDCTRLRISSQSLKRAWRTSDEFAKNLPKVEDKLIGDRTKRIGLEWIYEKLIADSVDDVEARKWTRELMRAYGAPEGEKDDGTDLALYNSQLVHIAPVEKEKLKGFVSLLTIYLKGGAKDELIEKAEKAIAARDKSSDKKKGNATLSKTLADILLVKTETAIDIAMFGRMLASVPSYGFEAAVQVAHAITVHKAAVEDDYFIAVDDLNNGETDRGAAHIGETGFGAGVFYLYICINRELLQQNLGGDAVLTQQALNALLHAVTKVSPTGKQNSFASRAYAGFVLAEKGDQQPRTLAQAFLKPVTAGKDQSAGILVRAIEALTERRDNFNKVYGDCADANVQFNVETGAGSLSEIADFIAG